MSPDPASCQRPWYKHSVNPGAESTVSGIQVQPLAAGKGTGESPRAHSHHERAEAMASLLLRRWHEGGMLLRNCSTELSSSLRSQEALSDTSAMSSPSVETRQVSENRRHEAKASHNPRHGRH